MAASAPVVLLRREGLLLVGHLAVGNGVAGLIQRRADDPSRSWTATVLGSGEPVHGANAAGLVCAALDVAGHGLVVDVLEGADDAEEAVAMLRALSVVSGPEVSLLLADAATALVARVAAEGVSVEQAEIDTAAPDASIATVIASLRRREPAPEPGSTPAAGLAAALRTDDAPAVHVALGPPSCSVFLRIWPGMELVPDLSASPEGAALARLAAAVAQTTGTDPELRGKARARLDRAEAEALREGADAERMAALMDEHTDDRGAAVRRLVAQAYQAELARQALEELAVPAPPGTRTGPRIQ